MQKTSWPASILALVVLTFAPSVSASDDPLPPAPAPFPECPAVQRRTATIAANNDEWTSTGIALKKGDLLILRTEGRAKIAEWMGDVGPNGQGAISQSDQPNLGALVFKIGTGKVRMAGALAYVLVDAPGTLKLRLNDTRYSDNAGNFFVHIIVIPVAALPEATPIAAAE